jgi:hypothetical protein
MERKSLSSEYPISASPTQRTSTLRIKFIYGNRSTNTANYQWGLGDFIFLARVSKTPFGNLVYMSHIHIHQLRWWNNIYYIHQNHFFFLQRNASFFICALESTERILIHKPNFTETLAVYRENLLCIPPVYVTIFSVALNIPKIYQTQRSIEKQRVSFIHWLINGTTDLCWVLASSSFS